MDMPTFAPNSLTPSAFSSVSASSSPSFGSIAAIWAALAPALEARFSVFNVWCAEVQATPAGKVIIALLCLVEITLVTLVVWRVRYLRQQFHSEAPSEYREKASLA